MKCFIILRQSSGTTDPNESLSIEVQEAECRRLAESHGFEVADVFREASTSGRLYPTGFEAMAKQDFIYTKWCEEVKKTGQFREGLGEALRRLDEVDIIICYDSTRLFRPLNGSFLSTAITQKLISHGVKLLTVKEGFIDFGKFQDNLVTALTSQINSEQLSIQREKAKQALKRLKDGGEYYAGLSQMHGYKKGVRPHEVEIDPDEAPMVRYVFKAFNDGMKVHEINRKVNEKFKLLFKKPCQRTIITNILRSPVYCGMMTNSDGELIKMKQLEGKELVTLSAWMNAKKKLDARKRVRVRTRKHWLPLSPFVYCGDCNEKISVRGQGGTDYIYYSCLRKQWDSGCKCKISVRVTEESKHGTGLVEFIKPLLLAEAMKLMKAPKDDEALREKLAKCEIALAGVKHKEEKLTKMWMSSAMDDGVYESSMQALKQKKTDLNGEKLKLETELNKDVSAFEWAKLMMKFKGEEALPRGEYEMLAVAMLKKIIVGQDAIEVKTTYGDVKIPRRLYGKRSLCRNSIIQMRKGKAAVYYYDGDVSSSSEVMERSFKKLCTLGELEVYSD